MADYNPPLKDMHFAIHALSGIDTTLQFDCYSEFDRDVVDQVVAEAGRFAAEVLGPINKTGDIEACSVENGGLSYLRHLPMRTGSLSRTDGKVWSCHPILAVWVFRTSQVPQPSKRGNRHASRFRCNPC